MAVKRSYRIQQETGQLATVDLVTLSDELKKKLVQKRYTTGVRLYSAMVREPQLWAEYFGKFSTSYESVRNELTERLSQLELNRVKQRTAPKHGTGLLLRDIQQA